MSKKLYVLLLLGLSVGIQANMRHHTSKRKKYVRIDTTGNAVGIRKSEVCYYHQKRDGSYTIMCRMRRFRHVGVAESSLTGTPGHSMYANYIGTAILEPATLGLLGSGKRLDFCDGECVRKR